MYKKYIIIMLQKLYISAKEILLMAKYHNWDQEPNTQDNSEDHRDWGWIQDYDEHFISLINRIWHRVLTKLFRSRKNLWMSSLSFVNRHKLALVNCSAFDSTRSCTVLCISRILSPDCRFFNCITI
jgi:hypothetical protein